ncbi:hypothetical protein I552_7373 [Mycobacterium xenopi 3993]|nr:hypothetical protein I552_7373 [Mycobacterium xenopi 3993]
MPHRVARNLRPRVEEALADTRIVVVQGARQVGKSTLATEITRHRGGRLVTLDDDVTRTAAATDPHSFVRQFPTDYSRSTKCNGPRTGPCAQGHR